MFYLVEYGFAFEFKLFRVPMKIIIDWNRFNIERGILYLVLFGKWGDDPRSVIQIGILGFELVILDYSGMIFIPMEY